MPSWVIVACVLLVACALSVFILSRCRKNSDTAQTLPTSEQATSAANGSIAQPEGSTSNQGENANGGAASPDAQGSNPIQETDESTQMPVFDIPDAPYYDGQANGEEAPAAPYSPQSDSTEDAPREPSESGSDDQGIVVNENGDILLPPV